MVIYALPYAAGSASLYHEVIQHLHQGIRLVPLELPGHGRRMRENLLESIPEMAKDAFRQIAKNGFREPYCLLGYSMGGAVCYELYQLLRAQRCPLPRHMFICSSDIPAHKQNFSGIRKMSDEELIVQLQELGGTPQEVLENKELMELILPLVRADFAAVEEYYPTITLKMNCGGTVIYGTLELAATENRFADWQNFFSQTVCFIGVEGGHFFIHDNPDLLAGVIMQVIRNLEETNERQM